MTTVFSMTPPVIARWIDIIENDRATIDGRYVNGIDMIHWNDDEKIVSVKVMVRPLKGLQALMPKMAELLAPS